MLHGFSINIYFCHVKLCKLVSLDQIVIRSLVFPPFCWVYGVQRHFQQYFSYIVAVSFIGG